MIPEILTSSVAADSTNVRPAEETAWILRLPTPISLNVQGALEGLRFAVKDNFDVAGLPTTAACPAFSYTPARNASVLQRLFDAGALLVGKTNLDQFACGLSGTRSPYGAVHNAFNASYVSGGSSSGSAYVVAKGEVDFALGTDTAGSGRVPAGLNNIVGLKPSKGLVSAHGVVPAAQSVDCVSIFARSVSTAVKVLEVAIAYDPIDPYSRRLTLKNRPFPAAFKFGVPDRLEFFGDSQAEAAFANSIGRLSAMGGIPVSVNFAPLAAASAMLYESALVAERYAAHRDFLDTHESDVIEPVRTIIRSGRSYSAADFADAQTQLRDYSQQTAALWEEMDLLVVPTAPTHYKIADMVCDPIQLNRNLGIYTNFVNLLDYAALSVPSSVRIDGLPFGITLIGPSGSDWQLADLGQRYHHLTGLRQGATDEPLPLPQPIMGIHNLPVVKLAVVGAHLSGMPLNSQLVERDAKLLGTAETAPHYKLFALPGTVPPKPGLVRVASSDGARIALEVWEIPLEKYGSFVAAIPAPLGIGTLTLSDGSSAQGFVCEAFAVEGALDISRFGGWRAYISSIQSTCV